MSTKRSAAWGSLCTLALIVTAGCGPKTVSAPGTTPASTKAPTSTRSTELQGVSESGLKGTTVEIWHPWFGVEASLFESQIADFNRVNEWGITVVPLSQSGYSELYSNTTSSLPDSDHPDAVVGRSEYAIAWDSAGYVMDLAAYVDDPKYGLSAAESQDFPAVFWSQDVVGGRRLGVPAERGGEFLAYDSTWARQLGFPQAPQTPDEFRRQACSAHQALLSDTDRTNDVKGGWLVSTSPSTFLSWMMAFGGGVLDGQGYRFFTPKNLGALTFVKQLYDDGCAWMPEAGGDAASAFSGRLALFTTIAVQELPQYARAMSTADNGDEWTILPVPGEGQVGLVTDGSSFIVLRSTPEKQLASWLFIRWMLSPENQKRWVEATGLLPLRMSTLEQLGDYQRSHPQWAAAVALIPEAQIEPQLASWRQVRVMIGDGLDAMYRANTPAGRVADILAIMDKTAGDLSR